MTRSLRIADGILRFRIIKLRPGVSEAPDMLAPAVAPAAGQPTEAEGAEEPAVVVGEPG